MSLSTFTTLSKQTLQRLVFKQIHTFNISFPFKLFQADGFTAIKSWVIACIVFVFGAMLEYSGMKWKRNTLEIDTSPNSQFSKGQFKDNFKTKLLTSSRKITLNFVEIENTIEYFWAWIVNTILVVTFIAWSQTFLTEYIF